MSASLNKAFLAGNLTRDPESKSVGGSDYCKFTIAVNKKIKLRDGQTKERVTYMDCDAWGSLATVCGKYLRKGRSVLVEGEIIQEAWEDRATGQKRTKHLIRAENVQFLGQARKTDGDVEEESPAAQVQAEDLSVDSEDMPF